MVSNASKTEVMILNQPEVVEIDMGDEKIMNNEGR